MILKEHTSKRAEIKGIPYKTDSRGKLFVKRCNDWVASNPDHDTLRSIERAFKEY